MPKKIVLSGHAREQLQFRGTSEEEIVDAIRSSGWENAERGKLSCRKDIVFNSNSNGREYHTKQVRPIFVDEADAIVVITVYVYYF